ncbi:hypothetical protein N2601_17850 [Rhizobium sp. CB3060]|uniref:hypothetical protein n=1 Tax=Rhizobium sp. CB3060 TaxID=3138255 RepID=UPI0021A4CBFE|nr:hypothetical protein [Rhizobium tropici]UWU21088.1 hypothetical protein N2601_17850 [Rhizobium tropici]
MASLMLYTAVAGRNPGMFIPAHVWVSRLVDGVGVLTWTNDSAKPNFDDGTPEKGHYAAVLAALPQVAQRSSLVIIAKEKSTLWDPFKEGAEGPKRYHHRKPNGEPYKAEKLIRSIDDLAAAREITIVCRPPVSELEREMLAQASDDAKARRDAAEEALAKADEKFPS